MGSRVRVLLVVAGVMAAALFTPVQENLSAQTGPGIVISELRLAGPRGTNDEFVELFNASDTAVNISGWALRSANNVVFSGGVSNTFARVTIPANVTIQPGCYFLITNNTATTGYSGTVTADLSYSTGIADDGGVAIIRADGTIADQIGFFNTTTNQGVSAYFEGTKITVTTPLPSLNRSFERLPDAAFGYQDTNNNANDFALITPSRPQNRTSPCLQLSKYPHEIQGAGAVSPLALGTMVNVRGVVTAVKAGGFFVQTEAANDDSDPNTSEGLFVSYAGAVQLGHVVVVTGRVNEFVPLADAGSAPMTELNSVTNVTDLGAGAVPPAHVLTSADLSASGSPSQLERYEGMRVTAPMLSVVSPTMLDGAFFAVLTGQTRPFREPGVQSGYPVLPCAAGAPCAVPQFDGNPERLRVDADGLVGVSTVAVSTGAVLNDVTGPLDFAARNYTLLPEGPLSPAGGMSVVTAPAAAADQFTVASLNLGAFTAARQAKASLALRDVLLFPDVVGVQGVSTVGELLDLAAQVNLDAAGAVQYQPYPSSGNAADPLGVGFLVRSDRVSSVTTDVVVSTAFDNAPVVLHATVTGPATRLPQTLTVVNSQFASLAGVERDDATGAAARAKRQAQADDLADYVQGRQINDPAEAIVALGDYNAFDFNDGYVDVVGAVRGVPVPADQVALASTAVVAPPLFNPDLVNPWSEQYSSLTNGNAQGLDHVLVNTNLAGQLARLAHARFNADFPEAFSTDNTTPVRMSDRDPLVAYFTFKPDVDAPVFDAVQDVLAEATGANGAAVTFSTPTAHDNLDASVTVSCDRVSGSTFALGNSAVTCSTQDLAGNASSVAFTVTVQDTTAPLLSTPGNQLLEATSSDGASFNFTVTATDAVTSSLNVACSPSSGVFALGMTTVNCSAQDNAGNSGSASFTVTVQDTTAPAVTVPANIVAEATSAAGAVVTFSASATDAVTAALSVACSPVAGSVFPLGTTTVTCSAQDAASNQGSASFTVTVRDTIAPVVTVPANKTVEAASAAGGVATFSATATDAVTTALNVTCSPASGSVFALGTTTVNCSTQDAAGNQGSASFTVTVRDTTAPTLQLPSPITAEATSASGRVVTFVASATDAVTASPVVTCTPASGSTFPIGTTPVNCVARDAANNTASGSFTVTITEPAPATIDGHMTGDGEVRNGNRRVSFGFDVKDLNGVEQGWANMVFRQGGGPQRFSASTIDDVTFSSTYGSYVETVVFHGAGCLNNVCNVRFEITAFDGGGPGRDGKDYFEGKVFDANGAMILFESGEVRNGGIQIDQAVMKAFMRHLSQRRYRR